MGELERYREAQPWLHQTLHFYLNAVDFDPRKNTRVLDIGCGNAAVFDYLALRDIYETRGAPTLDFTGVDLGVNDYKHAEALLQDRATFIPGDAQNIGGLVEGKFGLVFIRSPNPEVGHGMPTKWSNIFRNTKDVIAPSGILVATHHHRGGYATTKPLLEQNGYELPVAEFNRFSVHEANRDDRTQPRRDEYILIGQPQALH